MDADRIVSKLYIGSAPLPGPEVGALFDHLVLAASEYQPGPRNFPGVLVTYAPLEDELDPPPRRWARAQAAADVVAEAMLRGERVLVTCMAGRNRSGLIAALALRRARNLSGAEAMELVRAARPNALTNPTFSRYLLTLGRPVPDYGDMEWRRRFAAANPGARLVGRVGGRTLVARFPGIPWPCKLVGGSPEAPSCMQLRREEYAALRLA